jgi:WD40 repeat protein
MTGDYLVTVGNDNRAVVWDTRTWLVVARLLGHTGGLTGASFSPDDQFLVTSSYDETVRLWDVTAERELARFYPQGGGVKEVGFMPDGETIVTANANFSVALLDCEVCGTLESVEQLAQERLDATGRTLTSVESKRYLHE